MAARSRTEPRRRFGLRARLLVGTIVVAACSIGVTAWVSAQSTTGSIEAEQGQNQAALARIYDRLAGYAATHSTWGGVDPVLRELGASTGMRLALTDEHRNRIAATFAEASTALPAKPSAVLNPLAVDATLASGSERIDRRAVGPFRLTSSERKKLRDKAERVAQCMRREGADAKVATTPHGRAYVRSAGVPTPRCSMVGSVDDSVIRETPYEEPIVAPVDLEPISELQPTERKALAELNGLVARCYQQRGLRPERVELTAIGQFRPANPSARRDDFTACLTAARTEQLQPYVAPPALLFVVPPAEPGILDSATLRIAGAAAAILVLTVAVSMLLARPVLRPLHSVIDATKRMRGGDRKARAEAPAKGEVAELATAFNELSEHLARVEQQRTDMVNDISHELRTPLSNIRGWLVAAQDGVAEVDRELIDSLLEETLVLQHLVDDLQDLAAADADELKLRLEEVDAAQVLTQVAGSTESRTPLTVETSGDLRLRADPVRLRQVVTNLVSNAIRHTPPTGQITMRGTRADDQVLIEVADTGKGIAPDHLPHVFDRFWRADPSRSRATGGRGLGLAITRKLVEAHGGTVTVDSTLGVGTTFTV